jgi:hypothetical protein
MGCACVAVKVTHLQFDQRSEGQCETCGDEAEQVDHWLQDECNWPVEDFQDGEYGDGDVVEDDVYGPADPEKDGECPGEILVHCDRGWSGWNSLVRLACCSYGSVAKSPTIVFSQESAMEKQGLWL